MTGPTVSVCMPASRPSAYFDAALASALAQRFDDFEVVVTDDSGGALRDTVAATGDRRVRYVANETRLGLTGNHGRAIDESHGRYVAFLHDDDLWHPDYLARAVRVLDGGPDLGYVLSGADEIADDGTRLRRRPTTMRPGRIADPLAEVMRPDFLHGIPSMTVWRRTALDATPRPWLPNVTGDFQAFVDPPAQGWGTYFAREPLVRYRVHGGQAGATRQFDHRDGLVRIWSRYRFDDPRHEAMRRRILARSLLGRAGMHLRLGRRHQCRRDVAAALRTKPTEQVGRAVVLAGLALAPKPRRLIAAIRPEPTGT